MGELRYSSSHTLKWNKNEIFRTPMKTCGSNFATNYKRTPVIQSQNILWPFRGGRVGANDYLHYCTSRCELWKTHFVEITCTLQISEQCSSEYLFRPFLSALQGQQLKTYFNLYLYKDYLGLEWLMTYSPENLWLTPVFWNWSAWEARSSTPYVISNAYSTRVEISIRLLNYSTFMILFWRCAGKEHDL
jgi:hypothetical protein